MKVLSSWSGGKDSCYALVKANQEGHTISGLLNMMNENGKISRSHGLTEYILHQQANAIGVPIHAEPASWSDYEQQYIKALKNLKAELNLEAVVFGDIDLQPHRDWEEKVCKEAELEAILPLWQGDRKALVMEMIDAGIEAIIVSCNLEMGERFLGRSITKELVEELEELGIDACGENGEYHTVVINCPLFSTPVNLPKFTTQTHENYCFLVWDNINI